MTPKTKTPNTKPAPQTFAVSGLRRRRRRRIGLSRFATFCARSAKAAAA